MSEHRNLAAPLVEMDDVRVSFHVKGGELRAVDGVSIEIPAGQTLGLVGESGSGKSTLGRALMSLVPIAGGHLKYQGVDLGSLPKRKRKEILTDYQMVFQDSYGSLDPRVKVAKSIAEPLVVQGDLSRAEIAERVEASLLRVGLTPAHGERFPHEMSGGQRQRVTIARALILNPKLVVCDESVAALDVALQAQVLNLLAKLQNELGVAYVFITHDLAVAAHISHRIGVMYLGRLMEVGPADAIAHAPRHPYTQALMAAQPEPRPGGSQSSRGALKGEIPSPVDPPSGCRFRTRCPFAVDLCAQETPEWKDLGNGHLAACHFADIPGFGLDESVTGRA